MRSFKLSAIAAVVALLGYVAVPAYASPWTNANGSAPGFDWSNGHNTTDLFESPTVVGNQFIFTPTNFKATSQDGIPSAASHADDTMQVDIVLKPGFQLQQINIFELGDYQITGGGTVNVGGLLQVVDLINGGLPAFAPIATNPAMPQSTPTAGAIPWTGSATVPVGDNVTNFRLTLNNILDAVTTGPGQSATIQKKFASGLVVEIIIPEPASLGLLLCGAPLLLRRRNAR